MTEPRETAETVSVPNTIKYSKIRPVWWKQVKCYTNKSKIVKFIYRIASITKTKKIYVSSLSLCKNTLQFLKVQILFSFIFVLQNKKILS